MPHKTECVLGLDPGFARLGYAMCTAHAGDLSVVTYGCIETAAEDDFGKRLVALERELEKLIKRYRPTVAALEKLYFSKNVRTAMSVGQARGVLLVVLARHGLATLELTPQEVKIAATGYGKADKKQVQRMMQTLFHLKAPPQPDDAADALAIAVAGAHHARMKHYDRS